MGMGMEMGRWGDGEMGIWGYGGGVGGKGGWGYGDMGIRGDRDGIGMSGWGRWVLGTLK